MKKVKIDIIGRYKSYKPNTVYNLDGDLIVLSGINGSGKSQLLNIISKTGTELIERRITQICEDGKTLSPDNILLLSFRDNIDLGNDFGSFSVTYKENFAKKAWEFYSKNIKFNHDILDKGKRKKYEEGTLIFDNKGIKNSSWRSIVRLTELIKSNYGGEKIFNLSQAEIESLLPSDFIWRDENDIIAQVGNLFYIACCRRVDKQIECSRTGNKFDNTHWLKTAPWTILNQLFEELRFKYRFKNDYIFKTPNMEENPKLRIGDEVRSLLDLSDGEKTILKLALIALDEEISRDIALVLFDEYEAPLNPSLIESFYYVINKFYIEKGIQVIISTHSSATISLAPEYAQFYEIFPQKDSSPKIVKVDQFNYEELKKANRAFYDKIKNQEERISELERIIQFSGNMLLIEDKYDQIYKIAYLKIKGIENITEDNLEEKFKENCDFFIHNNFSCGGLYHQLISSNLTLDKNSKMICLFDFDEAGYKKFEDLLSKKENNNKIFPNIEGSIKEGLFAKHAQVERYALMLPIPDRLKKYVSNKTSSDCFIEVETLISEEFLKDNSKAERRSEALPFYKVKDKYKRVFWKDLLTTDKKYFEDFEPLFSQIIKIFKNEKESEML